MMNISHKPSAEYAGGLLINPNLQELIGLLSYDFC